MMKSLSIDLRHAAVDLDSIGAGLVAGMVAGTLIGGVGGRIAMRIVALFGALQPAFSWSGTLMILLIGMVLGGIYGALFGLLSSVTPLSRRLQSLLYGAILAGLTALPFLRGPTGELALGPPLLGVALFAPLPLLIAIAVGEILGRRRHRIAARTDPVGWFMLLVGSLSLAIMGMLPLMNGEIYRYPRLVWALMARLGLSFDQSNGLGVSVAILFCLAYLFLCCLLYWRGAGSWQGRVAPLTLLLLAGAFFGGRGLFVGVMNTLPAASLAAGMTRAAAAAALAWLLWGWPDGRIPPGWPRLGAGLAMGTALIWFATPLSQLPLANLWLEWVQWGGVALLTGGGLLALHRRRAGPWVLFGTAGSLGWFLILWAAMLFVPGLRLTGNPPPFVPLALSFFLVPWLLLPAGLALGCRRSEEI